jgi:hypothetical protein
MLQQSMNSQLEMEGAKLSPLAKELDGHHAFFVCLS